MTLWPGAPYEYAAVAGDFVFAAGACPIDEEGGVASPGDLEAQTALCVDNLREALQQNGADLADIVKATIYVVGRERADLVKAWNVAAPNLDRARTISCRVWAGNINGLTAATSKAVLVR